MTQFKCLKCNKIFSRKLHFENHINRKTVCVKSNILITDISNENIISVNSDLTPELTEIIDETKKTNACKYCKRVYSRNDSLVRHINKNSCKIKKEINDVYLSEIETLKKKFDEHMASTNIVQNSNNTINTVNNVTNQFNIVSIGKEDMSKLTQEELLKIATSGVFYPIVAAEIIHCNQRLPDYQNILISNLRSNKGHVYSIGNWVTKNQEDIIKQLMDIDKIHVSNIIKEVKVDDEKIKNKIEYTKDELNENKSHQSEKVKDALYSASKMIQKNKLKITNEKNEK